jgi:serine/threonine protein kinase
VICYELLTGQKPYIGGTAMEVLQQHVNAPLPALPPDLTRYEPFLGRLMAKSRSERFANAAEIMAATVALRGSVTPDLSATGDEAQPSAA